MQVVRAAGGVIMRNGSLGESELLIVHRPRYDDWTLPKGKAEKGESDEACALREVEEETSLVCDLEAEVAVTEYEDAAGRLKRVRYFAMTPRAGSVAAAQNEIDDVRWVTREGALETLSYSRDSVVVDAAFGLASR
jgi:8-oxo-dGTP pyrophosphatase MutT (NUDIX family)